MTNPTDPRLKPVKVYGKAAPGSAAAPRREPNPVLAGILAAVLAAVLWAVIAYATGYEIGWVAWGVGALIGFAVAKSSREPSPALGATAAVIAVGALILAKILILEFALPSVVEQEVLKNRQATAAMFLVDMGINQSFSPELQAQVEMAKSGDERQDGIGARMVREAEARAADASPAERERVVHRQVANLLEEAGFFAVLGRLFSLWDVVWIFLAIGSAWRIGQRGP